VDRIGVAGSDEETQGAEDKPGRSRLVGRIWAARFLNSTITAKNAFPVIQSR